MEIKINDKILELEFNLKSFKQMFKHDLNLKKAVYSNIKVIENKHKIELEEAKRSIYLCFDWSVFFRQINTIKKEVIKFVLFNVKLKDFKKIVPLGVTEDQRVFTFKEGNISESVIIIQDAIKSPYFPIDNLICNVLFDYRDDDLNDCDYGVIVELEKDKK